MDPANSERVPERVVSLVPSLTESLFELGFGDRVVGISDYCIYPVGAVDRLPRVGGPKNPRLEDIRALNPDLVIANQEENPRAVVEALQAGGVPVWVTFPKTVRECLDVLRRLAGLFKSDLALLQVLNLEVSLEWVQAAAQDAEGISLRYFCPIWQSRTEQGDLWWMTFNKDTYPDDLLSLFGGENVFTKRERRYPLAADLNQAAPEVSKGRDTRYPRVTVEELRKAQPELILLPNEPYPFCEEDRNQLCQLLPDTPAVHAGRLNFIDGSLITWYGTRLARAVQELPQVMSRD